jgi:hypothetical protein
VLVRVDLTPLKIPPRGNWKETWQQALEILRRCCYLDKDLVLPPMGVSGAAETFFVVASTDMDRSGVMTRRIREQLEAIPELQSKCILTISTSPVDLPAEIGEKTLPQKVQALADCIRGMIVQNMERKPFPAAAAPGSN